MQAIAPFIVGVGSQGTPEEKFESLTRRTISGSSGISPGIGEIIQAHIPLILTRHGKLLGVNIEDPPQGVGAIKQGSRPLDYFYALDPGIIQAKPVFIAKLLVFETDALGVNQYPVGTEAADHGFANT